MQKIDDSFDERLIKLEDMVAKLRSEVYALHHRKIHIWADSTTTMDTALDETWHWLTTQLPEGFTVAEVKWDRSLRNKRILRVDLVYEWTPRLTEVQRMVMEAFVRLPRPYNEEVIVFTHSIKDWKVTHPQFLRSFDDVLRATEHSVAEREALAKGIPVKRKARQADSPLSHISKKGKE